MRFVILCLLLVGCVTTSDKMLPDGTWYVEVQGAVNAESWLIEEKFKERATILCPQGHDIISKQPVSYSMGKHGIIGRFTCKGEESLTKKK